MHDAEWERGLQTMREMVQTWRTREAGDVCPRIGVPDGDEPPYPAISETVAIEKFWIPAADLATQRARWWMLWRTNEWIINALNRGKAHDVTCALSEAMEGGFLPPYEWEIELTEPGILVVTDSLGYLLVGHQITDSRAWAIPILIDISITKPPDAKRGDILIPTNGLAFGSGSKMRLMCVGHHADPVLTGGGLKILTIDGAEGSEPTEAADYMMPLASAMVVALGDKEMREDMEKTVRTTFVPSYRDKRGVIILDHTNGRFALYHDEIRCWACNQRILLKFPPGNEIDALPCPACESPNAFPHLTHGVEKGGATDENVHDDDENENSPFVAR